MVDMTVVDSTSIEAVGYDLGASELYVRFKENQRTYVIAEVPRHAYHELLRSSSKGQYYNRYIKPVYPNVRRL